MQQDPHSRFQYSGKLGWHQPDVITPRSVRVLQWEVVSPWKRTQCLPHSEENALCTNFSFQPCPLISELPSCPCFFVKVHEVETKLQSPSVMWYTWTDLRNFHLQMKIMPKHLPLCSHFITCIFIKRNLNYSSSKWTQQSSSGPIMKQNSKNGTVLLKSAPVLVEIQNIKKKKTSYFRHLFSLAKN